MFPPVDGVVLQNNPDFERLYNNLTQNVLNPDGTSKDDPAAKERVAIRDELDKYRLKAIKQHLLTRVIATASPSDSKPAASVPSLNHRGARPVSSSSAAAAGITAATKEPPSEDLLDLLLLLPALLDNTSSTNPPLPPYSISLLFSQPPLSEIERLLPELVPLVNSSLRSSALDLTRLTHPNTNPSFLHRHISSLPNSLTTLITNLSSANQALTASRLRTLAALTTLLASSVQVLAQLIRTLELKHGLVARGLELRATHANLAAQRQDLEAQYMFNIVKKETYDARAVNALQTYSAHLRDARMRGEERLRGLRVELADYGVGVEGAEGKEKVMREMSRVYREMGKQMDDVQEDLERLQKG